MTLKPTFEHNGVDPHSENGHEIAATESRQTPLLNVSDLRYSYPNGTEVLRGISLQIERGRNVAIIGPSGCGKSTLLQLMAGLAQPTAGSIRWDADTQSTAALRLSMMFQKDTLLPWLTVRKNVGLHYRFRGKRGKSVDDHIDRLLKIGGLEDAADRYPYQLSGGMRRRTQFLCAVAPNPSVILLDEPFSSLDEPTRIGLHQDVFEISRNLGMAIVLVTHDLGEAISLSDEIVVLTRRPAVIAQTHPVPFGSDRDLHLVRERPQFLELYGQIWHELNLQIGRAK